MIEDNFILREPLLDPKQRVIGFQFSWQQADSNAQLDSQNLDYLLEFVAGHLNDDDGFLLADSLVFLEALPELLHADGLKSFPPKNTVLILHKKYFADESTLEAVKELRALGFGICLRGAEVTTLERSFFAFVSHIEVQLNAANFASQAKVYASLKQSSVKMVARNVSTWQDFDACAALVWIVLLGSCI
jgi:EAL and modified HD-GYP domain-containing signal transduction protein